MYAINVTVCDGWNKKGLVGLRFATKENGKWRTCITEGLTHHVDLRDQNPKTYSGGLLGDCSGFRPIEELRAKFLLMQKWDTVKNQKYKKICKLTVSFVSGTSMEAPWEWRGETIVNNLNTALGLNPWLKLARVVHLGTPPPL